MSFNIKTIYLIKEKLGLIILPVLLFMLNVDLLMIANVEVIYILCCLCFKNIEKNIFFLLFVASFFVFLVSGDLAEMIFHKYYWIRFSEEETIFSRIALLTSLIFLLFGYIVSQIKNKDSGVQKAMELSHKNLLIQKVSMYLFYSAYIVLILNTLDEICFVMEHGYVAYYTSYIPMLPAVIRKIADLAVIFLCVFFATMPNKKDARLPIILFLLYSGLSLLIGSRGTFVYNLIFIFGYMFYRNGLYEKDIWIKKKYIIILCLVMPVFLTFLFIWGYIRLGQPIQFSSIGDSVISFFVNIGSSSKVIKWTYNLKDTIEYFKFYSLGDTLNYFKYARIFNLFSLDSIPSVHSIDFALQGHSYESYVSYYVMRDNFLNGQGTGGSFIAALYADFGYFGIALGSFIYGCIFERISNLKPNDWLKNTIKLYFLVLLLKAPRGSYDKFLAAIVNIDFWIAVLAIVVIVSYMLNRKNKEDGIV